MLSKNKLGIINSSALLRSVYLAVGAKDSSFYYSDIKDACRDSVFNEQQIYQIQNMNFAQQIKEMEDEARLAEEKQQQRKNLQYAAIALGLIIFVLLFFLLSRSIVANERLILFLGILSLLIVFEFINLLIHPYLIKITNHSALLMLLIMVCIAALLIPVHHRLEKWVTQRMVVKNKRIRLESAKRTITKLGEQADS